MTEPTHNDVLRGLLSAFKDAPLDAETRTALDRAELSLDAEETAAQTRDALESGDWESMSAAAYRMAGIFQRRSAIPAEAHRTTTPEES